MTSFRMSSRACSVVSASLVLPTIFFNASMVLVLLSKRHRWKPCETFLLNLAITDVLAGLFNFSSNSFVFHFISQSKDPCRFANITIPIGYVLGMVSFLTLVAIALERYMSIFHPFVADIRLRMSSVILASILIWLLAASVVIANVLLSQGDILRVGIFFIGLPGTLINAFCYLRILWFARKIRQEIAATAARYEGPEGNVREKRERSLAKIGGLMILTIALCYSPVVSNNFLRLMGYESLALDFAVCWSWNLANLSSLLDPIITCTFSSDIRNDLFTMWKIRFCRRVTV